MPSYVVCGEKEGTGEAVCVTVLAANDGEARVRAMEDHHLQVRSVALAEAPQAKEGGLADSIELALQESEEEGDTAVGNGLVDFAELVLWLSVVLGSAMTAWGVVMTADQGAWLLVLAGGIMALALPLGLIGIIHLLQKIAAKQAR